MTWLRSMAFNLAFYGWTVVAGVCGLPLLLFPARYTLAYSRFWAGGMAWMARALVGLDWEMRGREHLPDGPCIVAIKHQSAWDTLMYTSMMERPAVVLKRELLFIPVFGWLLARARMIAVDRKAGSAAIRSLLRQAEAAAAAGRPIVIAPEGTRSPPGAQPDYHPGVAALYTRLGLPVVPAALNSGLFWARRGFLRRPGRITVQFLEPVPPGLTRAAFMATLRQRIETASLDLLAEAATRDRIALPPLAEAALRERGEAPATPQA